MAVLLGWVNVRWDIVWGGSLCLGILLGSAGGLGGRSGSVDLSPAASDNSSILAQGFFVFVDFLLNVFVFVLFYTNHITHPKCI